MNLQDTVNKISKNARGDNSENIDIAKKDRGVLLSLIRSLQHTEAELKSKFIGMQNNCGYGALTQRQVNGGFSDHLIQERWLAVLWLANHLGIIKK